MRVKFEQNKKSLQQEILSLNIEHYVRTLYRLFESREKSDINGFKKKWFEQNLLCFSIIHCVWVIDIVLYCMDEKYDHIFRGIASPPPL